MVTNNTSGQYSPSVAYSSADNKFIITWSYGNIYARTVTSSGTLGSEIQVTTDIRSQFDPAVTYSPKYNQSLISWVDKRNIISSRDILE